MDVYLFLQLINIQKATGSVQYKEERNEKENNVFLIGGWGGGGVGNKMLKYDDSKKSPFRYSRYTVCALLNRFFVCTGTTRLAPSDPRQSGVRNHVLPRNLLYGESNGEQQCLKDSKLSAMDT